MSRKVFGLGVVDTDYPVKVKKELPKVGVRDDRRFYGCVHITACGTKC